MSKKRFINTRFWEDKYIEKLSPDEKLFYLYVLTNPLTTIAGVYEISERRISFDTGLSIDTVSKCIDRLSIDNKIVYENGWMIIINFIKNQSNSPKVKKGIEIVISELPSLLKAKLDTLSILYDTVSIESEYLNPDSDPDFNSDLKSTTGVLSFSEKEKNDNHFQQHCGDETHSSHSQGNTKLSAVVVAYESVRPCSITPYLRSQLEDLSEMHGEQNVCKAIKAAADNGKWNVNYIKAILDNQRQKDYAWDKQEKKQKREFGLKII